MGEGERLTGAAGRAICAGGWGGGRESEESVRRSDGKVPLAAPGSGLPPGGCGRRGQCGLHSMRVWGREREQVQNTLECRHNRIALGAYSKHFPYKVFYAWFCKGFFPCLAKKGMRQRISKCIFLRPL